jgi:hypothetical protein
MEIANVIVKTIAGAAAAELQLRVGADIVVRVQAAPLEGGKGLISLAGQLLEARLPPNLTAGQTLPVRVAEATEGQIVLRVRDDAGTRSPDTAAHAAGALAVSGDADLVRVATALAPPGLALPLPNGDALTLHVDGDEDADGGGAKGQGEGDGEAAFVLHSAEAAPALARGLKQATGTPARVALSGRSEVEPRPAAPHVAEGLDAYA